MATKNEQNVVNEYDEEIINKSTRWRNLVAFWILGMCNNYGYVVMLSAAHDILDSRFGNSTGKNETNVNEEQRERSCNTVSTGAILLADILPCLLIKLIAPFLPFVVHVRLAICILFSAAGFVVVSVSTTRWLAIMGVVVTSISSGLGEVTLISYSHKYSKQVISTWSSGTGGAGLIGSLSYAGLATWLKTSDTLLLMLIVPCLQAIAFWFILVHPSKNNISIMKVGTESQEQIIEMPKNKFKEKLRLIPGLLKYMIPLSLVYFFEYFVNYGLYELVQFDHISLTYHEQYRWLQVDYQIGVFISRSSVNLIAFNKIWLMAVLQFLNLIIILFEAIFYYIPNFWIVFTVVLWEGLVGGSAYVNTFYKMSYEVPLAVRQTSLGIATMADAIGIAFAGWLAIPVHNAICDLPKPTRLGS